MLLSLSLIPKDFKKPLMPLNSPLIHLGKDAIKRIIPLKIYAIALNELLRNVCTIDNLMPIVLNKIDTAVRAISAVIQLFRISIKDTRGIIDAILDGSIEKAEMGELPIFNLAIPKALPNVDPAILDPRDTYADKAQWQTKAVDLADRFVKNFVKYTTNDEGKALVAAGPKP